MKKAIDDKNVIKMKLKNKCDLFVRFCSWPGLEDYCSSRPWIVCGIVSRGSIIVGGTRKEKVRKQIEKQSVVMTFFVNNALLQLDFRLVRVS